METFVLSLLLGIIPETIYTTLFLIYTKDLKEKKIILGILIGIAYTLCIMIIRFQILFYIIFLFVIYIILKLLYKEKTQITDVFIVALAYLWMSLLSFVLMFCVNQDYSNYYLICVINKALLFLPFIWKNKFNIWYKKYYSLWNRNDTIEKPIKSITLRNISLILLNSFVFFVNIAIINIVNFISKVR